MALDVRNKMYHLGAGDTQRTLQLADTIIRVDPIMQIAVNRVVEGKMSLDHEISDCISTFMSGLVPDGHHGPLPHSAEEARALVSRAW
jgi:hypothetical protein